MRKFSRISYLLVLALPLCLCLPCSSLDGPFCFSYNGLNNPGHFKVKKINLFGSNAISKPFSDFFPKGGEIMSNAENVIKKSSKSPAPVSEMATTESVKFTELSTIAKPSIDYTKPFGSFSMEGKLLKSEIYLNPVEWLTVPAGDWSAIGLKGIVNEQDLSITFTIYSNTGELLEMCSSMIATFVPQSNKHLMNMENRALFLKGEWIGSYQCSDVSTPMRLTLETVGVLESGENIIHGKFEFYQISVKPNVIKAFAVELDGEQISVTADDLEDMLEVLLDNIDLNSVLNEVLQETQVDEEGEEENVKH